MEATKMTQEEYALANDYNTNSAFLNSVIEFQNVFRQRRFLLKARKYIGFFKKAKQNYFAPNCCYKSF